MSRIGVKFDSNFKNYARLSDHVANSQMNCRGHGRGFKITF